eukprot:50075-Eustigmatos_ZCMA.PRE.1
MLQKGARQKAHGHLRTSPHKLHASRVHIHRFTPPLMTPCIDARTLLSKSVTLSAGMMVAVLASVTMTVV